MNSIIILVVVAIVAIAIGVAATLLITRSMASSRAKTIIEEAKLEAEVLKKNKMLEAKEQEIAIKSKADK